MAVARFLVDTSAWARLHQPLVAARVVPLVERGLVATCSPLDLEILFSTRSPDEYEQVLAERAGLEPVDLDQEQWDRALEVQRALAASARLRAVGIPDLIVAATAERHGLAVLHYDADFDVVAQITGQDCRWVVPRGTVS